MLYKIKEDIFNAYLKSNNIKFRKGKFSVSEITHDINAILHMFINSYYFDNFDKKDFVFGKANSEIGDYFYIKSKNNIDDLIEIELNEKQLELYNISKNNEFKDNKKNFLNLSEIKSIFGEIPIKAYKINIDVFDYEFNYNNDNVNEKFDFSCPYHNKFEPCNIQINEKIEKAINFLKKNKIYEIVFCEDELIKTINLKKRKDFEVRIEDFNENNSLSKYIKFSNEYEIKEDLINFYGFKYIKSKDLQDCKLVIANNDLEIAGILLLDKPIKEQNYIPEGVAYFIDFVEVSKHFYGNKLGVRLVEEAINYAKENKLVLFRTSASTLGKKYIKDSITEMGIKNNIPLVAENERFLILEYFSENKNIEKYDHFNNVNKILKLAREKYNNNNLENKTIIKQIINEALDKNDIKRNFKNGI
jgi:GNAT superfamily N-acetyltransferase